jgi:NAD(P)-dependent dehydrogenase (short-subunit alcohol dehydrogenase family)
MTPLDPLFRLDGKVALITGGYGGIGAPVCHALCARGARVGVAGHDSGKAHACAATLRAEGFDAWSDTFDARSQPETERLIESAVSHFGRVDILVNLVGGQREEKTGEVTSTNFDEVLALNLTSAMFQGQAAARHMIRQNAGGKLLFFGSVRSQLALRGRGFAAYCAAKGGLSVLTKQLAAELAEHRINVNALAPTFTRTPQVARWLDDPEFYRNLVARIPMGRVAETSDIVGAVLFFVSPASDFVTGQTLYVDGGVTATQ